MAKKQTRRSISISRATYERLKAFCETQGISMSQVVEGQIGGLLGGGGDAPVPLAPRAPSPPRAPSNPRPAPSVLPVKEPTAAPAPRLPTPMTSQAARFAIAPPPPLI